MSTHLPSLEIKENGSALKQDHTSWLCVLPCYENTAYIFQKKAKSYITNQTIQP